MALRLLAFTALRWPAGRPTTNIPCWERLRSSAQLISYELALGLSLVGVVLRAGSLNLRTIVDSQSAHGLLSWNVFGGFQFVAFFIYLMAAYAETNRAPFDLPEAETELTAGYHTEYSSMKFAMFFMAEYANMITVGCVATLLFLGGWTSPFGSLIPACRWGRGAGSAAGLVVCPEGFLLSSFSISGCAARCPAFVTTN